ncbi:hypothetical protein DYU11_15945 [Fibrisoma montanum]|uniref:Hint domain-containing protein n=1 Tax=Fibrisoma montanum TaxID=2305895 RepID=A0A418M8T6_9BACT|nr:Hint domain-containing protein [Fibrisoma montanum]RIV22507.1 hypothetical protein DYU11_15945 [Fibrisoma montanum]
MKNNLLSFFFFLCCVMATQFLSQRVWAQATPGSMTLDQLKTIKAIKIANLDKDTYFKSGGFILDRYEERPAYVFNYSDGIPRKIYLYKVFAAEDTKELGLLAIYQNGKTNEVKPFVIPGASADRKAWDAYIDDLKYVGEKEPGLMSALGFVLSREMAMLMAGGGAKSEEGGSKKKEEYNFCFAADAPVTLADGSTKPISDVMMEDQVMSYDANSNSIIATGVTKVNKHKGAFAIAGVWLMPVQEITAGNNSRLASPTLLEATANHPVLTAAGRKPFGEIKAGDVLYRYEPATRTVVAYKAVRTEPAVRTVDTVYSLSTQSGSYLIGETVVLDK